MTAPSNAEAHRLLREGTLGGPLYWVVRTIVLIALRLSCGFTVRGRNRIPAAGPVVLVSNHKSFWDAFFAILAVRRPAYCLGKDSYFDGRWARPFLAAGCIPIRRGESDEAAVETGRTVLRRGGVLTVLPEGTRIRSRGLGTPKRGAARWAIETGAVLVPATITGAEKRRWPLPRKVTVIIGEPVSVDDLDLTPDDAAVALDRVWSEVEAEYDRWLNR